MLLKRQSSTRVKKIAIIQQIISISKKTCLSAQHLQEPIFNIINLITYTPSSIGTDEEYITERINITNINVLSIWDIIKYEM